jgi:predicted 2-oxoglutarate/Fe(II)-dependent dioxygenase YbiX
MKNRHNMQAMQKIDIKESGFYVAAREPGAEHPDLPTWATKAANPVVLSAQAPHQVERLDVPQVPGAFQLLNVLSKEECQRFIDITESLGYLDDAPVSLPRKVRHNSNITWVVDEQTDGLIWSRCQHLFADSKVHFDGDDAMGLNGRFRFYRYGEGDFFSTHTDGSWPGSRVIDNQLVANAYPDRWSQLTFLIFLSDDFEGGSTQFLVNKDDPSLPARRAQDAEIVNVRTPAGSVLCFPHGRHPLHCLHGSAVITSGTKYIIRTDVLYPA